MSLSDALILWLVFTVWAAICLGIYRACCRYEKNCPDGLIATGIFILVISVLPLLSLIKNDPIFLAVLVGYFAVGMAGHELLVSRQRDWFFAFVFCWNYFVLTLLVCAFFAFGLLASNQILNQTRAHWFGKIWWIFLFVPLGSPFAVAVARRVRKSLRAFK